MYKIITKCLFCDKDHEIGIDDIDIHIPISKTNEIELVTLPLNLCPKAQHDIEEAELLIYKKRLKHKLYISIYKLNDGTNDINIRVVFHTKNILRVSAIMSIDDTIKLINEIKLITLIEKMKKARKATKRYKLPEKKREQKLYERHNNTMEPLYTILRQLRGNIS